MVNKKPYNSIYRNSIIRDYLYRMFRITILVAFNSTIETNYSLIIPEIMFKIIQKTVSNYEEWWKHVYWMRLSSRERSDYYYWHSYNAWLKLNFFFILYKDTTGTNFRCWQLPKLWDKQGYSIWHVRQSLNVYLITWYLIFWFCLIELSIILA